MDYELKAWFEQEAEKQEGIKVNNEIIIDDEIKNRLWPLNSTEYNELEKSLLKDGCREPLIVWKNILVDGHNRYEICKRFDIPYKKLNMVFENKNEVLKWVDTNQLSRRNLTDEQRTILIGRLYKSLKQEQGGDRGNQYTKVARGQNGPLALDTSGDRSDKIKTYEKIADDLKVGVNTVKRAEKYVDAIEEIERTCGKETIDKIVSGDLKISKQDIIKIAEMDPFQQEKVIKQISENKSLKLTGAIKINRRKEIANLGENIIIKNDLIDLRFGDFNNTLKDIPDNSIDLILTDPPYPYEYLHCWTELGEFAQNKLKDGGFLIAYSGHIYLPEVINRVMSSGLKWYWLGSCLHTGKGLAQCFEVNMWAKHKPILFLYKGKKKKQMNWCEDVFISKNEETKDFHTWGQTVDIFDNIIKIFEPTIVCDPFTGGGTTAIACLINKVKFIGSEIDNEAYNISKKRIDNYDNR